MQKRPVQWQPASSYIYGESGHKEMKALRVWLTSANKSGHREEYLFIYVLISPPLTSRKESVRFVLSNKSQTPGDRGTESHGTHLRTHQ